jgi:hypothetical protein
MLRLLVGDECDEIRIQVTIGHPETVCCHSEPFDKLPETTLGTGRTGSAKNLKRSDVLRDSSSLCSSE